MELVFSDGVTSSQAQCFIDLTTIREDLTYSASLPNLYGLPPPECVARDQRRSQPTSLFQRPRRSTTASVLNCRASATSWSKLDRYPALIRARILVLKDRLASVVSKAKLRRAAASSSRRRSTARPAVTATISECGSLRAKTSASTYSETRRAPTSKRAAIVDLPAPFGPDSTTTEGCASAT